MWIYKIQDEYRSGFARFGNNEANLNSSLKLFYITKKLISNQFVVIFV